MAKFSLKFANFRKEVTGFGHEGYRIKLLVRPPMEDMWETFTHTTLFKYKGDAEVNAARITHDSELDMKYWVGPTSKASPIQFDNEGVKISTVPVVSKRYQAILERNRLAD